MKPTPGKLVNVIPASGVLTFTNSYLFRAIIAPPAGFFSWLRARSRVEQWVDAPCHHEARSRFLHNLRKGERERLKELECIGER